MMAPQGVWGNVPDHNPRPHLPEEAECPAINTAAPHSPDGYEPAS